jgi:DNA helicase II / ATP-dependent DNA helicase PcrA
LQMRLTVEQRNAVAEVGHVCLVSCPGSGKTRTIVAKLLHCIDTVQGSTRRVACITHTNAAADEIDCRLRELCFGGEDLYYDVCTIHGFALQNILRPFHHLLPEFRGGFTVLTSNMEEYSDKANQLIQRFALGNFAFEEFERIQRSPDGAPTQLDTLPEDVQRQWCQWLDENGFVTLNEIVHHSGRLVSTYGHIASALASRFAWILVDEFQDSSRGQILILKEIYRYARTTFFCVGDPNQSIYGFAGASPELLIEFAEHIQANTTHRLTGNFRSSACICTVSELLCASNPPMQAVGEHAGCTVMPTHHTVATPLAGVINQFLPAVRELNIPLGKVAVIASWWMSLYQLAGELRTLGIPSIGPGARPYNRSHIIGHLVEPIGAYLEMREAALAIAVQRALFTLLADLTGHAIFSIYDYKGRVAVCRILAEAESARAASGQAVKWIIDVTASIATVLVDAAYLTQNNAATLRQSAAQMVADIQGRQNGNELTVAELGIFARPENCLQLLTVHKAKGREFDAVAVIDAHDGKFPHFTISRIVDPTERDARYAESRRVVYVAATRAKQILMFFSDTKDYRNRPSPFLAEMGL